MLVLVRDELIGPPSWLASFRDLTLFLVTFRHDEIVIESLDPDPYYRWLKRAGGMDFVSDFVRPGVENGVRIDTTIRFPRTIVTARIVPENLEQILNQVDFYRPAPSEWDEYRDPR